MPDQTIKCPNCETEIPLTEALTGQIESAIKARYEADAAAKDKNYQSKLKELQQQAKELEAKGEAIDEQISERLKAERKKLAEQEKALADKQEAIDEQVAERLKDERKKIAEHEKAKLLAEQAEQTKAIEQELEEKKRQLSEAVRKELDLRKERQALEEEKQALELTVQRTLDEERKKIEEKAAAKANDAQLLKLKEKDQLIESLRKQTQELQRRAEQGSQEAQGESLEGALQDTLMQTFPYDDFDEIKKGQRGADILQTVRNQNGKECGKIVWEAKYTKNYSNAWIDKLKADQQESGAAIAVLATIALPKAIKNFGVLDGVWISDYASVSSLATALRIGLISAAREKLLSEHQDTVKDVIYRYVTGQEFTMKIRAITDSFARMKEELDRERRAMEKHWKYREKQIETVLTNVAGIQGSLQGCLGAKSLPDTGLEGLEGLGES